MKESKINKINTNINASISISKTQPFLLYNISPGYVVVYVNNGILATTAKPCVDAGIPVNRAMDEIKKGILLTI